MHKEPLLTECTLVILPLVALWLSCVQFLSLRYDVWVGVLRPLCVECLSMIYSAMFVLFELSLHAPREIEKFGNPLVGVVSPFLGRRHGDTDDTYTRDFTQSP